MGSGFYQHCHSHTSRLFGATSGEGLMLYDATVTGTGGAANGCKMKCRISYISKIERVFCFTFKIQVYKWEDKWEDDSGIRTKAVRYLIKALLLVQISSQS